MRARAARVLGEIGEPRAIPALAGALEGERDAVPRAAMEASLARIESLPPPPLHVRLMGAFRLTRAGEVVSPEDFQRPIVIRLLQYFALHGGETLPRDRILDDLWPDTPPDKAAVTFRSVYSRLRKVLEPYQRPKAPSRYFIVEGETYRFDPAGVVIVDAERFVETIHSLLEAAPAHDVLPLPEGFLAILETWQPLLPELPYEEWLLAPRQRVEDTYLEACLYAARAFLARDEAEPAARWASRAVERAPWLEEGYQILMRAHARQGQRAQALKVYQQAEEALERELAVEPSELTRWLRGRIEGGEEV